MSQSALMTSKSRESSKMYEPQVDDYVVWTTALGMVHEGWVYYVAEPTEPKRGWPTPVRYITIEIGTKPKPYCTLANDKLHKKIHVLLCCYEHQWEELKYVKRRKSKYDDTEPDVIIDEYPDYKSQENRYMDVQ